MKACIIHNPVAGQGDKMEDLRLMQAALAERGWEVAEVQATGSQGDATLFARRAAERGFGLVFAVGGDGTVAQIADGLVGSETALGVLPGGTGNVMARQLNLPVPGGLRPRPLLDAFNLLLEGQVRAVDVGRANVAGGLSRHFLCWSGVGFDAQVTRAVDAEPERKHRLGILAFAVAALETLRDYQGTRAIVRVDGRRLRQRLVMLVANNIQLYGAWFKMAPRATLDDGWLDVYSFNGRHSVLTFGRALRLLVDRRQQIPEVKFYQARRIEIVSARPLPVHVDGDTIGHTPAVIEIVPRALKLLVPTTAPPDLFLAGAALRPPESVVDWVSQLARGAQTVFTNRSAG